MNKVEEWVFPKSWREGANWRIIWMLTRGGGAAMLILLFYYIEKHMFVLRLQSRLLSTSIFASALLTFILISVYRNLSAIQDDQTSIMERQEVLMEAEHEPEVELDMISAIDFGPNWGPHIVFFLSNVGKGPAHNLRVRFQPTINTDMGIQLHSTESKLSRTDPRTDTSEGGEFAVIKGAGDYLRSNESRIPFYLPTFVEFSVNNGGSGKVSFEEFPSNVAHSIEPDILRADEKPDAEESKKAYRINFSDRKSWVQLFEKPDIEEGFDVDLEEIDRPNIQLPSTEEIRSNVREVLDFDRMRIRYELIYEDPEGNVRSKELLDRMIYLLPYADTSDILQAGIDFQDYSEVGPDNLQLNLIRELDE